jgi:hypothetical protein
MDSLKGFASSTNPEAIRGNQLLHDLQLFYKMKQEDIKQFIT